MSRWKPCKRRKFLKKLRKLGFDGPYSGSRHQFLVLGNHRLTVPSNREFSVPQLRMMMQQVEEILGRKVPLQEWERL